jgi:hypothetical protein
MTALVNALDNFCPQQLGENGHLEYGWSNNLQDKILQFYFQLTRTDENGLISLRQILKEMLEYLKHILKDKTTNILERDVAKEYLSILYRMVGHTRDIVNGKGECTLTYMMIYTWHQYFPELAKFALRCLVDLEEPQTHPYGSWKDIKYFCKYCKEQVSGVTNPLVDYAIFIMNEQLKKDAQQAEDGSISLVAKWIPREKSSFGWLYTVLATNYYKEIMVTAVTREQQKKAILKCKTNYRKLISKLNTVLETLQIRQCSNTWSDINFNKVTSVSISKQKKAFLNVDKKGKPRHPDREDRVECAQHFEQHIAKAVNGESSVKGKRVSMVDFTKQARQLYSSSITASSIQTEKDLLNQQWKDNATQTGALGNMIPMVDLSGSMIGEPLDAAVSLGIRIAEKSKLGKRIMTFSLNPKWINLDPYTDFVSQVKVVESGEVGYHTDFYKALNLILDSIIENKMTPEDVADLVLVILSDMQIDYADKTCKKETRETMLTTIKEKYADAGIRVHGKPYRPPHILFWNLRNTNGFPCLSDEKNVSMMSGFNPSLLNLFCDKGIHSLQSCTPWSTMEQTVTHQRYNIMDEFLKLIV